MTQRYLWQPEHPVTTRSDATTNGIRVVAKSYYSPERSAPQRSAYFFVYRIRITNDGDDTVRLIRRQWLITDGNGMVQRVAGDGVVGQQPELLPGEAFEYTSACPLPTRIGFMRGAYEMTRLDGTSFDAVIGEFGLVTPGTTN